MSDRLYFSVPDECDNMLAQRFPMKNVKLNRQRGHLI